MGHVIVHLIRHEKTDANLKRKYIGWTDESITTKEHEFDVPINTPVVYGSNLKRCKETAQLYFQKATYLSYENLKEINFGDFEMKTYEELKQLSIYRQWIDEPQRITPPNGECYQEFEQRVISCFQNIISQNNEYTFVVHGGVIRVLLAKYGPSKGSFQQIMPSHRTIYTLQWADFSSVKEGKRCRLLSVEPIMAKESI
ncbi:histidine phosphatase family protein [Lysinibacillus sp. SGAir0095]|uniref:histidine phosphatase family protein n=1 Tax=Lysinibacillus sp. SGAir0095 TaxID=2070463 RepID=UPI0010CD2239|nr:histidine phosphatase family protein [Lysinibacillus sp. SGAir0095]QCR32894.1 fructose-2,6-bisphosphatase [Lysinibacillus sp. SGAir0095]